MKVQCKKTKSVNNFILRKYNWYEVLSEEKNKEDAICAYLIKITSDINCLFVFKNYDLGGRAQFSDYFYSVKEMRQEKLKNINKNGRE